MQHASIRHGLRLLRRPDFAKLFTAYFITYTGNAMAPIALAFGVLEMTGSAKDSAFVIAAPILAQTVMLLFGGALADRTSRQRLMVFAECLAAMSQLTIAALFLTERATVPLLMLLMLINGTAFALEAPAKTGFITQVVARHELYAANALLGAARSSATMLGAACAGVLVALIGSGATIAVDAATFVVAALLIARIAAAPQTKTDQATLVEDLRLGWREFISHQWLWTIVIQFALLVAALEAVHGLLGPAVTKLHMNGPVDWGFIAAASGMGTIVGGLVALRMHVERPMWVASWCVFFFAGTPLALSLPAPLAVIVVASFIGGVAGQIFGVLWNTTLQTRVAPHMLSRVSAYDHMGSIVLAPLGIVAAGILFEEIGATPTLLMAAALVIVPTALVLLVPDVRRLRAV